MAILIGLLPNSPLRLREPSTPTPMSSPRPAVVVPMGYSYESLPSGVQLIGRPWSEPILIQVAYAYDGAPFRTRAGRRRRFPLSRRRGACLVLRVDAWYASRLLQVCGAPVLV